MLLLLVACPPPQIKPDPEESGYIDKHSELVDDSGDSQESLPDSQPDSQPDSRDSQDSGTVEAITRLDLFPNGITVAMGASWSLRAVGTDPEGRRADIAPSRWYSDDEAVVTVDGSGRVSAVGAGSTQLHAELGGVVADAGITVRDDGQVTVQVYDARDGHALKRVTVLLPDGSSALTDELGTVSLPWSDPGPLSIRAYKRDWNGVAFLDTIVRSITVYTVPKEEQYQDASLHGAVDLAAVPVGDWDQLVVGLAGAGAQGELGAFLLDDFLGEDRSVTVLSVDVHAAGNLFVKDAAEDYQTQIWSEPVAAWGLAGPMDISALTGASGAGQILTMLTSNLDNFRWDYAAGGMGVADATTELDLAPSFPFDEHLSFPLPALPSGFNGTEPYVLFSAQESSDGWIVDGFGNGTAGENVDIRRVPAGTVNNSVGEAVLLYNEVGGLGTGGAVATALVEPFGGSWETAGLLSVPVLDSWDSGAMNFGCTVDPRANFVRIHFFDKHKLAYDVYVEGSYSGSIPMADPEFIWADADVEILAGESSWASLPDQLATGILDPRQQRVSAMVRKNWEY